jgi:hypothetical protein
VEPHTVAELVVIEHDRLIDQIRATLAEHMARTIGTAPAQGWPLEEITVEAESFWHGVVVQAAADARQRAADQRFDTKDKE